MGRTSVSMGDHRPWAMISRPVARCARRDVRWDVHGFFWPVFPIVGWGIGVVMNAWDVYRNDEFDEQQIRREMKRLQGRR